MAPGLSPSPQPRLASSTTRQSSSSTNTGDLEYPSSAPSYLPAFDDEPWVRQELQEASETWRSEKWPRQSNVLILDHHRGESTIKHYNDASLTLLLDGPNPDVRFILLLPTNQEKIQHEVTDHKAAKVYYSNELLDDPTKPTLRPGGGWPHTVDEEGPSVYGTEDADEETGRVTRPDAREEEVPSQLNISRKALFKILTRYDIAPRACSHIRGQEQIFDSRVCRDENSKIVSFGTSRFQHARHQWSEPG